MIAALALVALAVGAAEAADEPNAPLRAATTEVRCGERTLPVCTKERVAALKRLASTLNRAAAQKPAKAPADPKAREELARYDTWLVEQSERAAKLVMEGERALVARREAAPAQMSFNLQYLQLKSRMEQENRQFTAVSNVMKTRHDTVKNSISNIR